MNLVSTIMQFLAPAIINRIAGSLGLGQGLAGKAIAAAIPAILAALAGSANRSGGAQQLSSVLGQQDPGVLGNFANMLGGPGQKTMADNGLSSLSSLLGGSSTNVIAGAVGKFAGIDSAQSGALMGMLAPVVLGQLAQTQRTSRLDANGLANLLNGQKDNIAAAMPAGFSNLLEGTGVLDAVSTRSQSTAHTTATAQTTTAHTTSRPAETTGSGFDFSRWLVPAALAVLGLYLLNTYGCDRVDRVSEPTTPPAATEPAASGPTATPDTTPTPTAVAPPTPSNPASVTELTSMTTKALGSLTTALGGITDEATAKAALPSLQDIARQIDGVKTAAAVLPSEAKTPIAQLVAGTLPSIVAAVERATGIPGAGAIITPVLEPMVANLGALAK